MRMLEEKASILSRPQVEQALELLLTGAVSSSPCKGYDGKPPGLEDGPSPSMPRPTGLPCGLLNVGNTCRGPVLLRAYTRYTSYNHI